MPINDKPRFAKSYKEANNILVRSNNIYSFPFSTKAVVKEFTDIPCRSYTKARKYGLDVNDLGSESAVIVEYKNKNIIFYDETNVREHICFSILHELGHYVNGHDLGTKDPVLYGQYEVEANYFAAQLLMPEQIIREFQRRGRRIDKPFLQMAFGVSPPAAERRIETLAKTNTEWYSRAEKEFDDIILFKFADFINNICPLKNSFDFEDEYERQLERDSWRY